MSENYYKNIDCKPKYQCSLLYFIVSSHLMLFLPPLNGRLQSEITQKEIKFTSIHVQQLS